MELDTLGPSQRLVLPFDARYLSWVGGPGTFMNATEIKEWIDSVSPFLQTWYNQCLVQPSAEHYLKKTRASVDAFVRQFTGDCHDAHSIARMEGHLVSCPSHHLMRAKTADPSDFESHTAVTACLIARYGIRHGAFKYCEDDGGLHLAAVMLLVSVIVDLEGGDYFKTLFKKGAGEARISELERKLHEMTMDASKVPTTTEKDAEIEAMQHRISAMKLSH